MPSAVDSKLHIIKNVLRVVKSIVKLALTGMYWRTSITLSARRKDDSYNIHMVTE